MGVLKTYRRVQKSFLAILVGLIVISTQLAAPRAHADEWRYLVEGTWYKSWSTCQSRAKALIQTRQYKNPHLCIQDSLSYPNGRWTLYITKKVSGSGSGGGGGGGWSIPVEQK